MAGKGTRRHGRHTLARGVQLRTGRGYKFVIVDKRTIVEELKDEVGRALAFEPCRLRFADGSVQHSVSDATGKAEFRDCPAGDYSLELGFGTRGTRAVGGVGGGPVPERPAPGALLRAWRRPGRPATKEPAAVDPASAAPSPAKTPEEPPERTIVEELKDEVGRALAFEPCRLRFADGSVQHSVSDATGKAEFRRCPEGDYRLELGFGPRGTRSLAGVGVDGPGGRGPGFGGTRHWKHER